VSAGFSHAAAELTGLISSLLSDADGLSAVVVSAAGAAGMPALGPPLVREWPRGLAIAMLLWEFVRMHVELTARNPDSSLIKRVASLKPDLPYGVAIAAGACLTLPETWWAAGLALFNN